MLNVLTIGKISISSQYRVPLRVQIEYVDMVH